MSQNIDWGNLGFGYIPTEYRYVAKYKDGAWDEGQLTTESTITLSECACVFQYAQTCFEGLKAYTTENGDIVVFRPDLNAQRMAEYNLKEMSAQSIEYINRHHHHIRVAEKYIKFWKEK
mgnify:CR=1 FL=1